MIRLILLRHGNTFEQGQIAKQVGARTDLPLTERGRQQASNFAQYLLSHRIHPHTLYTGTLKRQIETVDIIEKQFPFVPRITEPALTEIDYGDWEGLMTQEIVNRWPHEYEAWTTQTKWPQAIFGKSFSEHVRAIELWLDSLRTRHAPGDTVIGITSNGTMRLFYSFLKKEWNQLQQERQMERLKVKTGHFCDLSLGADSLEVVRWNVDPTTNALS